MIVEERRKIYKWNLCIPQNNTNDQMMGDDGVVERLTLFNMGEIENGRIELTTQLAHRMESMERELTNSNVFRKLRQDLIEHIYNNTS
eukprot:CAMPEP_0118694330 /NCGR_PEP_ID=MMETSP0800-20121206/12445_1 /TAXON_ID=210618 ORGANISM="Striatella unipunctata, Strain CCMP2910" /NCGR_SAMPLE_ID=MMETSP0800 /ASSEMBLY_ACC=CAM_ASM_000638 /LENGTH=87 /DNA_ID=CAMNT_0006592747 /DNA_START=27 /DNA_END=290 /DNA_ORIENTATION=-